MSTTRRFFACPAGVAFDAAALVSPFETTVIGKLTVTPSDFSSLTRNASAL